MTVVVEVIVDRGVNGGKLLQGLYVPELRHRAFSSSKRLVRVLGPIIEPTAAFLTRSNTDHLHRSSV